MRIGIISSTVFKLPLVRYGGLEQVAYDQARGLQALGHQVVLFTPDGSTCPNVPVFHFGPERISEKQAYNNYWKQLPACEVIIDHSVTGDQHLLVKVKGKHKWVTMESLYQWALDSPLAAHLDSGSTRIPVEGLEVLSATSIHDVEWKQVSFVMRHARKDPIHSVKVRGCPSVHVTAGHSMIVAGDHALDVARADDCVGKFSAVAREIPTTELDMQFWPADPKEMKDLLVSGGKVFSIVKEHRAELLAGLLEVKDKADTARSQMRRWERSAIPLGELPTIPEEFVMHGYAGNKVQWPVPLSDSALMTLGMWIGDGCYDRDVGVRLSTGQSAKYVADSLAREFGASCSFCSSRPDVNHQINSAILVALMRASGFNGKAKTKRIPDWVFSLSRRQIGLFLKGYFSADGHANKRICVSSVNLGMLEQASVLLSMCGIRSNLWVSETQSNSMTPDRHHTMGELCVSRADWGEFLRWVGFAQEERNEVVRKGILTRPSWTGDVPRSLVRIRDKSTTSSREDIISPLKLARRYGTAVADKFANSSVTWREILCADATDRQDQYVYDLCVPGPENFFVGLVCCHNSWEKNSFLLKEEGRLQAPILAVMHAPVDTMYRALPNVPKFCAVLISEDQRAHFEALHNRPGRTAYNPVDTDRYKPMTVKRNDRALFLARFSAIKGADIAIAACKEMGMPLDLIGDTQITNEPDYFHHCASLCDGEKIRMVGPETRGGTVLRYSQAHVMLHPNKRFREPFGLAPVESMLCGCPVISFDNGAMRETILHGETGMVVKDDREFTEAVRYAMQGVSDKVRKRCREWAMKFDIATCARRYEALCMEALNTGGW